MVLGREVTAYAVASALAFACDFAVLAALVQLLQWHYLAAATAAFMVGATVAYVLSICFVFRYRRVTNRRVEFLIFSSIGAAGLATNAASMFVGVEWRGVQ